MRTSPDQERCTWLLSAYHADSHAAWANWLQAAMPEMGWQLMTLPGRHFRWRIRGNPISWLDSLPQTSPGLIVATSMVDVATLRGLHSRLADIPWCVYFHENQFAYPLSTRQVSCLEPQLVQLYGGLATRYLLFNSAFNLDSYLAGVDGLLRKMPDALPGGIVDRLAAKAEILPVPISLTPDDVVADPRLIVWNHRWDYDKGPEVFAAAILQLHASGEAFRLALLGPRPARPPTALQQIRKACGDRILVDDKVDSGRYREILSRAGIVVSSARHEFQGLAIMEAVTAGCSPLVPDALCYPEQYAEAYRYPPGDVAALAERLRTWLHEGPPPAPDITAWSGAALLPRWRERLHALYRQ